MTILVTGAPGWLGNCLVEKLIKEGKKVRCLVLPGLDLTPLEKMGAEVIYGDVTKKESLLPACEKITTVIHAAGIIHPKRVKDFYRINAEGTKNILEAAVAKKVKKFIYISSNSAQGCNKYRSQLMKEEHQEHPEKGYGKSKYLAEQAVRDYQQRGVIQTVILRPCWFYGPGQPDRMTKLMSMIKSGRPIIFGDGKNIRSMTYIGNLVQGVMLAENKEIANGKTYWIADKQQYTTIEIYREIARQLSVELRPRHVPRFVSWCFEIADDILQFIGLYNINFHVAGEMVKDIACDTSKARQELGYEPKISLAVGMKNSIAWAKKEGLL